ncbi:hypothetical protein ABZ860_36680 [Microbispora sp. NPDC046973]|uniref:hypothetical protein n=1 Tax=Microbispora sp. NPDC046973 TaxID=3155022 RepID=UPI0033CE832F
MTPPTNTTDQRGAELSPYGWRNPFLRSPLPPSPYARPVREPERPGDGRNVHGDRVLRRDRQREGGDESAARAARAAVRA